MSTPEPLAVPPQPPPRGASTPGASAAARSGKANCAFCGRTWFGEVAYCPYCGRRSASAMAEAAVEAPPVAADEAPRSERPAPPAPPTAPVAHPVPALQKQPASAAPPAAVQPRERGLRPKTWRKALLAIAIAAALAVIAILALEFAVAPGDGAMGPGGRRSQAGSAVDNSPSQPPAAAPAPRRLLCSAANEAAGLCNPN